MQIINCSWEFNNLGCRVAEVSLERNEVIDKEAFRILESDYDYIVTKIPASMVNAYYNISQLGYYFVETQISLAKKYKDFTIEKNFVKNMLNRIDVKKVENKDDIERVLGLMTPNMFNTDRIYLDPYFGPEYSLKRYRNWTRSEFELGTPIYKVFYDGQEVAFIFYKMDERDFLHGLLGGLFESYQNMGIGAVLLLVTYWLKEHGNKFITYKTKVSSNNLSVIQMYNFMHFEQTDFEYVFVKHIK